jgi:putative addiction module component (TIGR02574 family)
MSETVQELHERALSLSPDDRATLLEMLLASVESKSAAQKAWAQLANRRRQEVRAGHVLMVPGEEALERIRAKLA